MGCGCGKSRLPNKMGRFVDVRTDDYGLVRLSMDGVTTLDSSNRHCEPYHGVFDGTYLYVVGLGTEHEKLFLRSGRRAAIDYAKEHGDLEISNLLLARSFCHDTVVAVLGA
jgi:hypothetical protein